MVDGLVLSLNTKQRLRCPMTSGQTICPFLPSVHIHHGPVGLIVPKPDQNFRPNPARSVSVDGILDDVLIAKIAPQILSLRAASTLPIGVYINSPGGSIRCLETLHSVLKTPDADGKRSRIITVVIGEACSAAATLLALGDYALAYPEALIHFHGVRLSEAADITMEDASTLAERLNETNAVTAMRLVRLVVGRLVFHYSRMADQFDKIRSESPDQTLSQVECFALAIKSKLTPVGTRIVSKALERWKAIKTLSDHVFAKLTKLNPADTANYEAGILREIVKFEIRQNKGTRWSLNASGMAKIIEDYSIVRDYHVGDYQRHLESVIKRFGTAFLTTEEMGQLPDIGKLPADKQQQWFGPKILQRIRPFLYFSVSLCRHFQEQENPLTPPDAYWLGAIDEIQGSGFPCLRAIAEQKPEEGPQAALPMAVPTTSPANP
jgi:ATP-dependent protease ClpP protease subunit